MTEGYEEDLDMYEESASATYHTLDNDSLLRPIKDLNYPQNPASIDADAPVSEALAEMVRRKLGALLVMKGDELVGIFAERDALMKGLFEGGGGDRPVREFMTPDPVCLSRHDSIALALNHMVFGGFRHIPIVDAKREVLGILVMRDVVRYVVSFFPEEVLNVPPHSEHQPPDHERDGG